MNEKEKRQNEKEQFIDDCKNLNATVEQIFPPDAPDLFIGQLICFLCAMETIGLPSISTGWRCIQAEANRYFLCKKCCPSSLASASTWQNFYVKVIRKFWEKDFRRPLNRIQIYIDSIELKKNPTKTPSGTNLIATVSGMEADSIPELLRNVYLQVLPSIDSAVAAIPASEGKLEFAATGDCEIAETIFNCHLRIEFESFGGVSVDSLPEDSRAKAATLLPLSDTLERLSKGVIDLAFAEMERQDSLNLNEPFFAENDDLTMIGDYLYKIIYTYGFALKTPIIDAAAENAHLN